MRIPVLLTVVVVISAWGGDSYGQSNNIVDFDGVSNVVGGGRWSYLVGNPAGPGDPQLLTDHFGGTNDNWCLDAATAMSAPMSSSWCIITRSTRVRRGPTI